MKMQKKEASGGVGFARKAPYEYEGKSYEADISNGDKVVILDEGAIENGQFGDQHNFKISTKNGDKKTAFNQASINALIDSFGDDSKEWVGKEVRVITKKDVIGGKKVIIAYFVSEGWGLDEYGELVNSAKVGGDDEEIPF